MTRTTARWSAFGAFAAMCCVLGCDSSGKHVIETKLLIVRKTPPHEWNQNETHNQFREDYVATHAAIIKSPTIIRRALKQPNIVGLKIAQGEDAPWNLIDALDVRRDPDSKTAIITIDLKCDDAAEGKVVMEAIIKSYQAFLDESYKNVSDKTLELILLAKQTLKEQLDRSEQEYQTFRTKNPFLLLKTEGEGNTTLGRLRVLSAKRTDLLAKLTELDGRLAWVRDATRDKNNAVAVALKVNEWAARSGFDKLAAEARQGKDALAAYTDSLTQEMAEIRSIQNKLEDQILLATKDARDISNYEAMDVRLRRTIQSNQSLFDSIVKRVNELGLTKDFGGYDAQVISPPRAKKVK